VIHSVLIACHALLVGLSVAPSSSAPVSLSVELIDGTRRSGSWDGLVAGEGLRLRDGAESIVVALDDVSLIEFASGDPKAGTPRAALGLPTAQSPELPAPPTDWVLYLNDGGQITGRVSAADQDRLTADFAFATGVVVQLEQLAAIQWARDREFKRCEDLFRASLKERLPSEDVLITRDRKDPKLLRGRLERLTLADAAFQFVGKSRTVQIDKLYGMVLATGTRRPASQPATFHFSDGSTFSGQLLGGSAAGLDIRGSFGSEVSVPIHLLRSIRVHSDRVAYLSDLSFVDERVVGRLHRSWPVQRDRTVAGKPIVLGGRGFDKGIGCHSFTELRFKLDGAFETFVATIAVDESVRPRGSVLFRVEGDGRMLFDSGLVTGATEPRDLQVAVKGVREMTLVVDYGDGLDLADHAVWAGARVLRPAKNGSGVQ